MTNELSVPNLEVLGNTYVVRWDEGVTVRMTRIYEHRDYHVDAEITIQDESELAPHLLGPLRTSITKTWRAVISDLEKLSERMDWRQRLTQATILVLETYRAGTPVLALGAMPPPQPTEQILSGLIWEGMPTLMYGPGGVGKSILALNFLSAIHTGLDAGGLTAKQSNCLILDWETSENQTWWRNREILQAREINPGDWPDPDAPQGGRTGMVYYRFMAGPLINDVEFLKAQIAEKNIGTICIDSAGPACGGEPENASSTLSFFEALRSLSDHNKPLQSLILAHVTHAAKKGANSSPFGSVYWQNIPRNTFELQSAQTTNANYSDYALHHRKSNLGPLRDPIGIRLTWDRGCTIEGLNIRENAQLAAGLPYAERALMAIEQHGPQSSETLADLMDATMKVITATLSRDDRFTSVNGKWDSSETNW